MENNKTFEGWYGSITELINENTEVAPTQTAPVNQATPTATTSQTSTVTAEISSDKKEMIKDVDTIMSQLAKLSVHVKESSDSLSTFENEELQEEVNEEEAILELDMDSVKDAGSKMADWIFYAPKYRNMQKKINKMRMNALDIKLAIDLLPNDQDNKAKRDALSAKKTNMDEQIKELQSAVDAKSKERGEYIQKVLNTEKIKGKMELVKRASGQEDDPAKKKELADSFRELNKRFAEEQSAIKQLQDKEKAKETTAKKTEEPKKEEPKTEEPKKEEQSQNKTAELEADIKSYNDNISTERNSIEKAKEELKSEKDPEKTAKLKDSIQKSNDDIKQMLDDIKELKAEFKKNSSAKESLMFSANELELNELAIEISTKENWQFENNSTLYSKYKIEIDKAYAAKKINESSAISIADKFRMLLG